MQDLSHPCHAAQRAHVESTLRALALSVSGDNANSGELPPIVNVFNKSDLLKPNAQIAVLTQHENTNIGHLTSARNHTGLHSLLKDVEQKVLAVTGRRKLQVRVPSGGPEMAWLYKNAAVVETKADEQNAEKILMQVVISQCTLDQFMREFC